MKKEYLKRWYVNHYEYQSDCSFLNDETFVPEGFLTMEKPELVQDTLRRYGILQQPVYGKNVEEERWIEERDWIYYTEFWPEKTQGRVQLCFEGLDTICDIVLNGQCIGHGNNMHISYRFDVSRLLRYGECNRLYIRFYSPVRWVENYSREGIFAPTGPERLFVRKAHMNYGWDFTGRCVTMGIWKEVYLEYRDAASVREFYLYTKELNKEKDGARLGLTVRTDRKEWEEEEKYTIRCRILYQEQEVECSEVPEGRETDLFVPSPKLWWPRPYGEQPLYTLELELLRNGKCVDFTTHPFGIRTVEIEQKPEGEGKTFTFLINGKRIFVRGANWVPIDTVYTRIEDNMYRKLLKFAADGNISMLRVWGGGIYESELFFRLCEEYGILVFQDFMLACGVYPQDEKFCSQIKEEAEFVIRKYRNYTALACWSGDNENDQAYGWAGRQEDFVKDRINKGVIKECCERLDPHRFYAESSPFSPERNAPGGEEPNSDLQGDMHLYRCGLNRELPGYYKTICEYQPRFMSEFGFISLPDKPSYYRYNFRRKEPRYGFASDVIQVDFEKLAKRWRAEGADTVEIQNRLIGFTGLYHSLALKYWIEYMRSLKGVCSGALYWKFNDPAADNNDHESLFPGLMSSIDFYGKPKMTYYYTKRAYQDVILAWRDVPEAGIWYANERQNSFQGTVTAELKDFSGTTLAAKSKEVTLQGDSAGMLMQMDTEWIQSQGMPDPYSHYIRFSFRSANGKLVLENMHYLVDISELVNLKLQKAEIHAETEEISENLLHVKVKATGFIPNLRIAVWGGDGVFSDNDFPLGAEEEKEIEIRLDTPVEPHVTLLFEACNAQRVVWKRQRAEGAGMN